MNQSLFTTLLVLLPSLMIMILFFPINPFSVYRRLRWVTFPPKGGIIADVPISSLQKVEIDGYDIFPHHELYSSDGIQYYVLKTIYSRVLVDFKIPKKKLDPFIPILSNNKQVVFRLRIRFDEETFRVYEVQNLIIPYGDLRAKE